MKSLHLKRATRLIFQVEACDCHRKKYITLLGTQGNTLLALSLESREISSWENFPRLLVWVCYQNLVLCVSGHSSIANSLYVSVAYHQKGVFITHNIVQWCEGEDNVRAVLYAIIQGPRQHTMCGFATSRAPAFATFNPSMGANHRGLPRRSSGTRPESGGCHFSPHPIGWNSIL